MVLDGNVSGTQSLNATLALPALTTTGLSETVYVYAAMTGTGHSIVSISDSLGRLTFSRRMLVNAANALGPSLDVWAAQTTHVLTSDVITITVSSAAFIWSAGAVAWKGGNQSTPYDINGPWGRNPITGGGTPSISGISTDNPNNVMFAFCANNSANTQVAGTSFIILDTPSQSGNSSADEYYVTTGSLTNFTASFGDAVPDTSAWTIIVDAMQRVDVPTNTNTSGSVGIANAGAVVTSSLAAGEIGIDSGSSVEDMYNVGIGVRGTVSLSSMNVYGQVGISASSPNSGLVGIGVSGDIFLEQIVSGNVGVGTAGTGVPYAAPGALGIGVSGNAVTGYSVSGSAGIGTVGTVSLSNATVSGSIGLGGAGLGFASAQAAGTLGIGTLGGFSLNATAFGTVGLRGYPSNIDITSPSPPEILREIFPVQVIPYRHGLMMVVFNPSDFSDKQDNFGSLSEYPFYQMGIAALPNSIVNHTIMLPKIMFYQSGLRYYYNPTTNEITTQSLGPNNVPPILSAIAYGKVGVSSILTDIEISSPARVNPAIGIGVSGVAVSSGGGGGGSFIVGQAIIGTAELG